MGPWLVQTFYKTVECAMLGADSLDTADAKLSLVTPITGGVTSARMILFIMFINKRNADAPIILRPWRLPTTPPERLTT